MKNETTTKRDERLLAIAQEEVAQLWTLDTGDNDDCDDIYQVDVCDIKNMLERAYAAGHNDAIFAEERRNAPAAADDDNLALAFEDDGCVIKAMKAQMSPETLEAIWDGIARQIELEDSAETRSQLKWLQDEIECECTFTD